MNYLKELLKQIKINHMIRSKPSEKEKFRDYVEKELISSGYIVCKDEGTLENIFHCKRDYINIETKNEEYKYIITAHYDTPNESKVLSLLSFASRFNIFQKN